MFDRRLLINFDFILFITVLTIAGFGVANLYSICQSSWENSAVYFYRQIYWILIGLAVMVFILPLNYLNFVRYAYFLHVLVLLFLLVVIFLGKTKLGSQRWLTLGPFNIQPSELAKISFIFVLGKFFSEHASLKPFGVFNMWLPLLFLGATFALIFIQPDLGTAGIIVLLFISVLFFMRIKIKSFLTGAIIGAASLPLFWLFLKDYQKLRVRIFLNPELDPLRSGYQIIQSKIAIGSGGFLGKGYMLGTQNQLRFLPEQHTDFAFSVWGEEWGFAGCLVLLLLFFMLLYRGLCIAFNVKNFSGSIISLCLVLLLFWQIFINLSMTIGLFPVVGVPLPLFSYGGSSMVTTLVAIGLLLNIGMRKFKY